MPFMKLNVAAVTSSQPPHSSSAARSRSVRGARPATHRPAISSTRAAGSSQATWPPISAPNNRVRPVAPQPFIPPTLPVSSPVSRPNPLYPKVSSRMLLCWEPPMYGRDAAGHSATVATHQPAATTIARVASVTCPIRRRSVVGAATR